MEKFVLIVNYNTTLLTQCCIKSINKFTPGCKIYVFDNSDKTPFVNIFDNVEVIDNTKGQIIDFDEWLKKYPDRFKSGGKRNNFGSAKHCYSVEKAMDIINRPFVLMDSDVLIKKDFSDLFDDRKVFVGGKEIFLNNTYRLIPCICFINTTICKEKNIHYFDENHMHGLYYNNGENYDTGGWFYYQAKDLPHKEIVVSEYVEHFNNGSWFDDRWNKNDFKVTPEKWLEMNKILFETNKKEYKKNMENKKVVYTVITGDYDSLRKIKKEEGFDYICFTNNKRIKSDCWEIRELPEDIENSDLSNVKKQRKLKILPHLYLKDYDLSVYIDGNIDIVGSVNDFIEKECQKEKGYIFIGRHPERDCVYDEAKEVIRIKKDNEDIVNPQVEGYKQQGFPEHFGLTQTCIVVRYHNNKSCIRLMNAWWAEIESKSHRDQLSLPYVLWKDGKAKITELDSSIFHGDVFNMAKDHSKVLNTKKILFLVQSCNKERYIEEEQIIRETWGKRLRKNCDLYFYRGDGKDTLDGDVLKLNCGDELNDTFIKTMRALSVFRKTGTYDFIVRTNTSNWINVDLLLNTIETLDTNKRELIGTGAVCNSVSKGIPFLRGNLLIINRQMLNDLFEGIKVEPFKGVDDVSIALTLCNYYNNIGVDYMKTLKTINSIVYDADFKPNYLLTNVVVRCVDWIKKFGSQSLYDVDELYLKKVNIATPKPITKIETYLGNLNI